jgi:hypothetical protein
VLYRHHNRVQENKENYRVLEVTVVDQLEEWLFKAFRLLNFNKEFFPLTDFLDFNPTPLLLSYKHIAQLLFLLNCIEVVNDHTHEEINNKLATHDHEGDKVNQEPDVCILLRDLIHSVAIYSIVHYIHPALGRCHLKQSEHRINSIVEICRVSPPLSIYI